MKLSIKENLSKFHLINEGWMEDLFDNYDEDILYFTGTMLQQAFPDEDISNHPMAEWIANSTKGFLRGKSMPLEEPHKTKIINAFQEILKFIKESENPDEDIRKIKSKKPLDALKYVEEEAKRREEARKKAEEEARKKAEEEARRKEEENITPEVELKDWLDRGLMKVIGRGPKGSFWVKPLKGEFFGVAQCGTLAGRGTGSQGAGEFGIGCQRGETGGFGAVGFGDYAGETYTLLGKAKNGYYTALMSTGYSPEKDEFVYHSLQYGNNKIGSQDWGNWSAEDFANAFVDFMIKNPYGIRMYKEEGGQTTTNASGDIVSSRTSLPNRFAGIKNHTDIFYRLLREHPNFLNYYDIAIRRELGEEEYAAFQIKAKELYESDPERFMKMLPTYLKSEKGEVLDILKNKINFKDFVERYGEEPILQNISDIIKIISYEEFEKLIKPHISFNSFLQSISSEDLKELFRFISEKNNSAQKSLDWLNDFIKEEPEEILELLGDGKGAASGLVKLISFFKTPRLKKHQNYTTKDGVTTATYDVPDRNEKGNLIDSQGRIIMASRTDENNNQITEIFDENGNVLNFDNENEKKEYLNNRIHKVTEVKEVIPSLYVLDPKRIRDFLKDNKNLYKKIHGDDEKSEINFIRQILLNSNEKERERDVKKEKDKFISYYDEQRKKGNTDLPGIIEYSKILYPKSTIGEVQGLKDSVKVYKLDKKDIKEYWSDLFKYYYESAFGSSYVKFSNTLNALLKILTISNVHESEVKKYIDDFLNVIEKKFGMKGLVYFVENVLYENEYIYSEKEIIDIFKDKDVKDSKSYIDFIKKLKYEKEKEEKESNFLKNIKTYTDKGYETFKIGGSGKEFKKEKFLDTIKKDGYNGKIFIDKKSKSIIYHIKDKKIQGKYLNEERIRKYIQNLFESNFKK
jgi:hypothetical protein